MTDRSRPTRGQIVRRALRLRCPLCGETSFHNRWFATPPYCTACLGLFRREDGYWFSASIFNYVASALIGLGIFFAWIDGWSTPIAQKVIFLVILVVVLLLALFPFTRVAVLALDLSSTQRTNDDYLDTYAGPNRKIRRLRDEQATSGPGWGNGDE